MNRFVRRKSLLTALFVSFAVCALFADAVNVTDWCADTSTIHFEEAIGAPVLASTNDAIPSFALFAVSQQHHVSKQLASVLRRVVFDQDSPSLEAVALVHATAGLLRGDDPKPALPSVLPGGALYLQNCALLI